MTRWEQRDILGSGITFSINTNGKKKADNSITFPTKTDDDQTVITTMDAELIQTKVDQSKYQKIHPIGFKDIADAELTTSNPYGIQTAIGYTGGWLIYEEAIPMALFTRADAAKEWAFNIKINALQKTGKPEPPGTRTSNGFSITRAEAMSYNKYETSVTTTLSPAIDFWGRFTLAKQ